MNGPKVTRTAENFSGYNEACDEVRAHITVSAGLLGGLSGLPAPLSGLAAGAAARQPFCRLTQLPPLQPSTELELSNQI